MKFCHRAIRSCVAGSYLDVVGDRLLAKPTVEAPRVSWRLEYGNVDALLGDARRLRHSIVNLPDKLLDGVRAAALELAYLDNGIAVGEAFGEPKILAVEQEEAVQPLIAWELERVDDAFVQGIRERISHRPQRLFEPKNLGGWHAFLLLGLACELMTRFAQELTRNVATYQPCQRDSRRSKLRIRAADTRLRARKIKPTMVIGSVYRNVSAPISLAV